MRVAEVLRGLDLRLPSPVTEIRDDRLAAAGVRLLVKRDDLIHPDLPGNKWRKLHRNLIAADEQGHRTLLTFGGAYSNHLHAVAAAGTITGLATIGVVRGEEHLPLNPTLRFATEHGMRLRYMDRETYRRKNDPDVVDQLREEFGEFYLIPEGGSNDLAVRGCLELAREIDSDIDVVCCPCGTGGTLAGLAGGLADGQRAIGFSALKGGEFLNDDVAAFQRSALGRVTGNWRIERGFHFGGFAKRKPALDRFIDDFETAHGIRLEWIYVAKMLYGIFALVDGGEFQSGATVLAVVTG